MIIIYLPLFVTNNIYDLMIRKSQRGKLVRQIVKHDFDNVLGMLLFQKNDLCSAALINESK